MSNMPDNVGQNVKLPGEDMPELANCPFCGSQSVDSVSDAWDFYVECAKCGACGPLAGSLEEAEELWNDRA